MNLSTTEFTYANNIRYLRWIFIGKISACAVFQLNYRLVYYYVRHRIQKTLKDAMEVFNWWSPRFVNKNVKNMFFLQRKSNLKKNFFILPSCHNGWKNLFHSIFQCLKTIFSSLVAITALQYIYLFCSSHFRFHTWKSGTFRAVYRDNV